MNRTSEQDDGKRERITAGKGLCRMKNAASKAEIPIH